MATPDLRRDPQLLSVAPASSAHRSHRPLFVPIPPTPLIGRAREMRTLIEALENPDVRLVTLTGPGGVGKTRLALEMARFAMGRVVYVPMTSLRDPSLVPLTIGQHLGFRDLGEHPVEILARLLDTEVTVLMLDNMEQLLPATPLIADLLARCPHLKVVVTSRARLHLSGEHEFPVSPLTLPAETPVGGRAPGATSIMESSAVDFFCQRAVAIDPSFANTDENAYVIAEICRRLDGLPLALELAASRSKVLPPAALLARLATRLDVLSGGPRDVPSHQRTMRDAIGWSHDLLSPNEMTLFRRLAVFVGGFTLDAVAAVAFGAGETGEGYEGGQVLDGVEALVDHSLLQRVPDQPGEPRFTMLETIREFALERLVDSGEDVRLGERHAGFFLELAERATLEWNGPGQLQWLEWLAAERPNLRAALEWFRERSETEKALRMASAIGHFHWCRGHHSESRALLESVLAMPNARDQEFAWASAMTALGLQVSMQGDYARAADIFEQAIAAWRPLARPLELSYALWYQGLGLLPVDPPRAGAPFEEGLAIARQIGVHWLISYNQWGVGQVTRASGDLVKATALFEEARSALGENGCQTANATAYWTFGQLAWDRGDIREALALHGEALQRFREIGKPWGGIDCVEAIAILAGIGGRIDRSLALLAAADAWRQAVGMPRAPVVQPAYEAVLQRLRSATDVDAFDADWSAGRTLSPEAVVSQALDLADELAASSHWTAAGVEASKTAELGLTPREVEVLRLLAEGCSDREIADQLSISPRTVGGHVTHLLGKLGVSSRSAAISYALRQGVL